LVIFDVPTGQLIAEIAMDLKKQGIERPKWSLFVKTGVNRERVPENRDWFYLRLASVLYRVYKDGPVGTESLRTYYGGKKNKGTKKHHFYKASGKVVRTCLQLLEKQGFIKKEKKGRVVTGKGHSYLNKKAKQIAVIGKHQPEKRAAKGQKSEEEKAVAAELKKKEQEHREKERAREEEKKAAEKKKEKKGEKEENGRRAGQGPAAS